MLFSRCCSGARIVSPHTEKTIQGTLFHSYGAHFNNYPYPYLTIACAIGSNKEEIDLFMERLDKILLEYKKKSTEENKN